MDMETQPCNEIPCPSNNNLNKLSLNDNSILMTFLKQFKERFDHSRLSFLVNGGWGEWSEWDECPVSCGGADQGRTRVCDNPAPQFGGDDCTIDGSSDSEIQRCNENPCPSNKTFLGHAMASTNIC